VRTVKTAIVGYGYAGRVFHAQLVQATAGLELYAVASRDPGRREAARKLGVKTCATVDELLDQGDIELVILATPHDTHAPLAIKCLNAGKHVVTDKIMCLSTAEADAMITAARQNKRMLSVFHNRRWDGDFLTICRAIEEGLLGDLLVVESSVVSFGKPDPNRWRGQRRHGGGSFRDWGAHLVDQALQMIDSRVVSVYCDMLYTEASVDVETSARCLIKFENGVRYVIETGCISAIERHRWYIRGTEGALVKNGLDPQEDALRRGEISADLPQPPQDRATVRNRDRGNLTLETVPGNWPAFYQNIADHLLRGAELSVKPEQVRRAIAVFDAAARSAENEQVVETSI